MGLVGDAPRLTFVDLVLAGGGRVHYRPTSMRGLYDSDVNGYFGNTTLQWTGREWRLRRDDGVELLFPESQNARRLEQAALVGIQRVNGEPMVAIDRDRAGNLRRLSASGARLDFEYDTANRVTAITGADTSRQLRFEYQLQRMPDSKERRRWSISIRSRLAPRRVPVEAHRAGRRHVLSGGLRH